MYCLSCMEIRYKPRGYWAVAVYIHVCLCMDLRTIGADYVMCQRKGALFLLLVGGKGACSRSSCTPQNGAQVYGFLL